MIKKRVLTSVVALILLALGACTVARPEVKGVNGDGEELSMRVLWTVSSYRIGKDASWGDKEAKEMLFKPLDMTEDTITFDGRICKGIHFQREKLPAGFLKRAWRVEPQELGLAENDIELFRTNCEIPGFRQYLRVRDGRLVVRIKGVFFYFEPFVQR